MSRYRVLVVLRCTCSTKVAEVHASDRGPVAQAKVALFPEGPTKPASFDWSRWVRPVDGSEGPLEVACSKCTSVVSFDRGEVFTAIAESKVSDRPITLVASTA